MWGERSHATERLRLAREVCLVCRRLYEKGLIAGQDGNVSVRLPTGNLLVTPAGLSKVDVKPDDLAELAPDGTQLRGRHPASSEVLMHLRIYAHRADVGAVVHAHPPTATGFGVAGEGFMDGVLPEVIFLLGDVPLVPYAMPGTHALADALVPYLSAHDVFLLANHGATAVGASLRVAHQRMESLEHAARILLVARTLGRVHRLSDDDVAALREARERARAGRRAT